MRPDESLNFSVSQADLVGGTYPRESHDSDKDSEHSFSDTSVAPDGRFSKLSSLSSNKSSFEDSCDGAGSLQEEDVASDNGDAVPLQHKSYQLLQVEDVSNLAAASRTHAATSSATTFSEHAVLQRHAVTKSSGAASEPADAMQGSAPPECAPVYKAFHKEVPNPILCSSLPAVKSKTLRVRVSEDLNSFPDFIISQGGFFISQSRLLFFNTKKNELNFRSCVTF